MVSPQAEPDGSWECLVSLGPREAGFGNPIGAYGTRAFGWGASGKWFLQWEVYRDKFGLLLHLRRNYQGKIGAGTSRFLLVEMSIPTNGESATQTLKADRRRLARSQTALVWPSTSSICEACIAGGFRYFLCSPENWDDVPKWL